MLIRNVSFVALLLVSFASAQVNYAGKPYGGRPQVIPGRIQAEFYDLGGEGVAYHDSDSVNSGSGMLNKGETYADRFRRDEGVDISYTKRNIDKTVEGADEIPGDLYLGWTAPGEWVKYTVDVREAGTYRVKAHLTSRTVNARIGIAVDGADKTGPLTLPTTGHWHRWRIADNLAQIPLEKGTHVLTLTVIEEGNFNIDYLEFVPVSGATLSGRPFEQVEAFEQVRRMGRGINIIGYDPLWKAFDHARFNERHFRRIKEGGFDHVRINLEAFDHMDANGRLDPAWLTTLDWVVQSALDNGLIAILDEHDFGFCGENPESCKTKLMAFWRQVAPRYKDAPGAVLFEILNEPNSKLTAPLWNSYLAEALSIIRETNPARTVVIGPAFWNNIHWLDKLQLSPADRNIIVTVHYYLPMEFTHQGAPWNQETAQLSGVKWGTGAERQRLEADFAEVQKWSKANARPILLGEFGAYEKGEMESRVRYTAAVARAAESLGWAWSYWQFDSDFIAYDIEKEEWVTPIWKALVP
jgi:endoglucanase